MTLELSQDEYNLLVMELGYVAACHAQKEGFIPKYLKKLTDTIIVGGGGKPYWTTKETKIENPSASVVKPGDLA